MHGSVAASAQAETRAAPPLEKDLLRFITCGSVDDGKSTLIGRMLYETNSVPTDQLEMLAAESRRFGTQGNSLDLALLVDGLSAEREQGITIDIAYRYFATESRKFIVIDAPGHEQYTRNMVTGASQADYGVLLVDARQGLTEQTRRHARVLKLLGVSGMVLAVNEMDRVRLLQDAFDEVVGAFAAFAREEGIEHFDAVPLSALTGANVASSSSAMPWYDGPALLSLLETVPTGLRSKRAKEPFRMAVQLALRPDEGFRGFAGTIASGSIAVGDRILVQPSGHASTIARIVTMDGDLESAGANQAVVLVLSDEVDCSRGDVIASADKPLPLATRMTSELVWLSEQSFSPTRDYVLKSATRSIAVRVDLPDGGQELALNAMRTVSLETTGELPVEPYKAGSLFGAFILLDKETQATVAAGMIGALDSAQSGLRNGPEADIVWFDAGGVEDSAHELSRIVAGLSASGNRVMAFDDGDLQESVCTGLDRGSAEWGARAYAVATLAARSGATVVVATASPRPEGSDARDVSQASAIAPDWVI